MDDGSGAAGVPALPIESPLLEIVAGRDLAGLWN